MIFNGTAWELVPNRTGQWRWVIDAFLLVGEERCRDASGEWGTRRFDGRSGGFGILVGEVVWGRRRWDIGIVGPGDMTILRPLRRRSLEIEQRDVGK